MEATNKHGGEQLYPDKVEESNQHLPLPLLPRVRTGSPRRPSNRCCSGDHAVPSQEVEGVNNTLPVAGECVTYTPLEIIPRVTHGDLSVSRFLFLFRKYPV